MTEAAPRRPWAVAWPILKIVLQIVVLAVIAWYAVACVDLSKLRDARLDWPWIVAGAVVQFLYLLAYALLWHVLTVAHHLAIPVRKAVGSVLFSLIGKYVPMKVGMIVLRTLAYKRFGGHSVARVVLCCYLEWALSVYAAVIVGTVMAFLPRVQVPIPYFKWLAAAALVVGVPFIVPAVLERLLAWVARRFKREPIRLHITWPEMLGLLLGYAAAWMLLGASLYCLGRGVSPSPDWGWPDASVAYALAGLAGIVALFFPAGLGVRDGMLMFLMAPPLGPALALTVSALARAVSVVIELAAVALAWLSDRSLRHTLDWARRDADQPEPHDAASQGGTP